MFTGREMTFYSTVDEWLVFSLCSRMSKKKNDTFS